MKKEYVKKCCKCGKDVKVKLKENKDYSTFNFYCGKCAFIAIMEGEF